MIQLREKKVGVYTVRELSMRETMRVLSEYPNDVTDKEVRGAALLGAAVTNGSGQPLGLEVLDLPAGLYQAIMRARAEVNDTSEWENPVPEGEAGDPGNV
jgi:hypothetical protein